MVVVDTHALVWLWTGEDKLGPNAGIALDNALDDGQLAVSAMTFWEIAMLKGKGRLNFPEDVGRWRRELLEQGIIEIPLDGEIGIRANELPGFHADPADRIIVATALTGRHLIITADEHILRWRGSLNRMDARE